jgi:hypothetical protein
MAASQRGAHRLTRRSRRTCSASRLDRLRGEKSPLVVPLRLASNFGAGRCDAQKRRQLITNESNNALGTEADEDNRHVADFSPLEAHLYALPCRPHAGAAATRSWANLGSIEGGRVPTSIRRAGRLERPWRLAQAFRQCSVRRPEGPRGGLCEPSSGCVSVAHG